MVYNCRIIYPNSILTLNQYEVKSVYGDNILCANANHNSCADEEFQNKCFHISFSL